MTIYIDLYKIKSVGDRKKFILFLTLTVAWFIFGTYLSHEPGEQTRETSMGLVRLILSLIPMDEQLLHLFLRKAVHVVIFAVLTLLLRLTLYYAPQIPRSRLVMAFPVVWAFLDEATKPLVEGRHFSVFDTGLNWLGVVIGWMVFVGGYYLFLKC